MGTFDLYDLAVGKYMNGLYEEAIEGFRKSIFQNESWEAYQGLGLSLLKMEQQAEAIDAFSKSIELQPDLNSYYGLGSALFKSNRFPDAIKAFRKSLAYKEQWNVYHDLGLALYKDNNYEEAIDSFNKSLALDKKGSNKNIERVYSTLAEIYTILGNERSSIQSWDHFFSHKKPICEIDPFLGMAAFHEDINQENLDKLIDICDAEGFNFHPSFEVEDKSFIDKWSHLLYLHIPKCGGTSFERPLSLVVQNLMELNNNSDEFKLTTRYLNTGNIFSDNQVLALKNQLRDKVSKKFDSIFLSSHGSSWTALHKHMNKHMKAQARIITTLRDPRERLRSHIKHRIHDGRSITDLIKIVNKQGNEFDNAIYRYIHDCISRTKNSFPSSEKGREINKLVDQIDFIDIDDANTISNIKSAFLSASSLPNILQFSKLNDSSMRTVCETSGSNIEELELIFDLCIQKGYLKKDESIDFNILKGNSISRLGQILPSNNDTKKIHPLLFITTRDCRYLILPVKQFIENPKRILQKLSLSTKGDGS